jgi:hypothetical protein
VRESVAEAKRSATPLGPIELREKINKRRFNLYERKKKLDGREIRTDWREILSRYQRDNHQGKRISTTPPNTFE